MKRLFIYFYLLIFVLSPSRAVNFIYHPNATDCNTVWFHKEIYASWEDAQYTLHVATNGYATVYINGRNVMHHALWPARKERAKAKVIYDDIILPQGMLRSGRNVVSVWYSPAENTDADDHQQVSLSITARTVIGNKTICATDAEWDCHIAPTVLNDNGEDYDTTDPYLDSWKTEVKRFRIDWIPVGVISTANPYIGERSNKGWQLYSVRPQEKQRTARKAVYVFPESLTGLLRITVRDAVPGQRIHINGMTYICSGETDEQFVSRFHTTTTDTLIITTGSANSLPEISEAEILTLR